jgi:putative tryptophan/tyrosine transport system substrate-binding protein
MRPHPVLPVACVALLAIGSTATGQTASRPARIGMLCATVCPTVVLDELRQLGWIEGSTILIDRKPAASRLERLPQLAKELVQSKPDLIIATSSQPVRAAKDATIEIPIVMLYVADPVGVGLAQSLAHPGGNLTGVTTLVPGATIAKSLQLLKELLPTARRIAVLINPTNEVTNRLLRIEAPPAAAQLGFQLDVVEVREIEELAAAVARAKMQGADALLVPGEAMFHNPPNRLPDLAAEAKLPALYLPRALVEAGGLMSYSPDFDAIERRGAHYVDRILRGANPAELPIEQPTRYQLVINLKTAKALGLDVPSSLVAAADEVIE